MAEKKYPGDADGFRKLENLIYKGCGPKTSNITKATGQDVVGRLTDTSKYTGSHKERFDENGKGKGLTGRYATDPGTLQGNEGYVSGYKGMGTYKE